MNAKLGWHCRQKGPLYRNIGRLEIKIETGQEAFRGGIAHV